MEADIIFDSTPLKKILQENKEDETITKEQKDEKKNIEIPLKKPNKPISPYIFFVKDFKEKHGTVSLKDLGKIWAEVTLEEKQKYVKLAEEDQIRYKKEMELYVKKKVIFLKLI